CGDPLIDVLIVVEWNIPRVAVAALDPGKFTGLDLGIERIGAARHVMAGAQVGVQSHPIQHVVRPRGTTHGCLRACWSVTQDSKPCGYYCQSRKPTHCHYNLPWL